MEPSNQEQVTLTPKLIFKKIIQAKNLLLKNWWVILLFLGIGTGIGFYIDSEKNNRLLYISTIVFSVSGGGSSQDLGAFGSLFGMGGASGSSDASLYKGENLFYIAKTRPVLEKVLLTKVDIGNGKKDLFINYYLDSTFIRKDEWEDDSPQWANVRITHTKRDSMPILQREVFDNALIKIKDAEIAIAQPDMKTSFYELKVQMENERVAKTFTDLFLDIIQEVYQQNQNKKSEEMERILERRVAELQQQLNATESRLARTTVVNVEAVAPTAKAAESRLTRQSSFVSGLYMESARNLENLRMSRMKETPLFTVIEPAILPLDLKLFDRPNTKFGAALGLLLGIIFILIKDTYKEALRDLKEQQVRA